MKFFIGTEIKSLNKEKVYNVIFNIYLVLCILEFVFRGTIFIRNNWDEFRDITYQLGILIVLYNVFILKKKWYKKNNVFIVLLILNVLTFVFNKYNPTITEYYKASSRALMVTCLYILNDKRDYDKIFVFFMVIMIFTNIYGFVYDFNNISFSFRDVRIGGIYTNYNLLGMNCLYATIVSFYFLFKKENKFMFSTSVICLLTSSLMLYLSACRTGFVALAVIAFIYLIRKYKKKMLYLFMFLLFISIVVLAAYSNVLFSKSLNMDEFTRFETVINDISSWRYVIQKEALTLIKDNLLLGYGLDNMKNVFNTLSIQGLKYNLFSFTSTHNIVLDSLFESGLFETVIYMSFLIRKSALVYENLEKKEMWLYISLFIAGIVNSMLDRHIGFYMYAPGFFFWIALSVIDYKCLKKE